MKKITINKKEFFVIDECSKMNYTLCVAATPWGNMSWAENNKPNVLNVANSNNPDGILCSWIKDIPDEVKQAMLPVDVSIGRFFETDFFTQNLYGVRTFIPSYDEWNLIPEKIRKKICRGEQIWTRTIVNIPGSGMNRMAWAVINGQMGQCYMVNCNGIVPAFYLANNVIEQLLAEREFENIFTGKYKRSEGVKELLEEIDRKIQVIRETTYSSDKIQNEGIKTILIDELDDVKEMVAELLS